VALANGINANLLRRWMIEQGGQRLPMPEPAEDDHRAAAGSGQGSFRAVRLDATRSASNIGHPHRTQTRRDHGGRGLAIRSQS
jgi:hypothetical protein